jgi:NAD(P)-dependent dehydrogenase (short-subunit alcohol dehydrogenase family)
MLLQDKIAVLYGAGGAIGGAVARRFAREGARVYLTGRHFASLENVARDIVAAGGSADVAVVDALDEGAIDRHLQRVVHEAGRVDLSVNAVGIANTQLGVPLIDLAAEHFSPLVAAYVQTYFLTARLAARRMLQNKAGVIMTFSAVPSRSGIPLNGGYGAAMAAKEALTRALSSELAPHGIRVVGLRPHAIPETPVLQEVYRRKSAETMTWEQWQAALASRTHPRRLTTLAELASAAVFAASDLAAGLTGTTLNLTMGHLDD